MSSRSVRPKPWLTVVVVALAALCGWCSLPAAAQTASSALVGRVQDGKGSPLPGATVTASNEETGLVRTTVTGSDGAFRLPSLPVGTYKIVADLTGFATVTVESVKLNVATERSLEISMSSASVEESITVVDDAPLVQTSPSIGTVVSQSELENLPLNGRQFANLASLAPGTTLTVNSDPTKPGQQTIALNGGIGRNVNYIIDGGDNTDDTIGGALQNFNIESVQEFKIQTQQYKAEYGRSTGGVLSVVTKTGTNQFAGSAYGFYRNESLNSETETEKTSGVGKQPYDRKQYGASVGGPIVKDKAHFFATWEKTQRDTSYTIATGGTLPTFDGQSIPVPFTDELGTAKVSYDISAKQYLQVRYGYQKNADKYGASPLTAPSALGTITNDYSSVLAGHTVQLGAGALNEAVLQYTKFKNTISADSDDPSILFPSGARTGQNGNTPQTTQQRKLQLKDDFSWSQAIGSGRHDFKVGVNYIDEPTLKAEFTTGVNGIYSLLDDKQGSPVVDITFFGGFAGVSTPVKQYSAYLQDDWSIGQRLKLNLGIRYDYWQGFDVDQRSNPIWQELSTQTKFHESYLADFQGGRGGQLKNDSNNFGPRLGFSYDVKGDGRHLLRGGWGIYYDFPYTNATILFPSFAVQSNYGVSYNFHDANGIRNPDGSFFQPGQPLPPNQLPGSAAFPPNDVASPTLATPQSTQSSLGYSFQVNDWLGLNLEGVSIRYSHIPFSLPANPFLDANGKPQADRRFPDFGPFRLWYGKGKASYDGGNLGIHVRLAKFELQGFYTYSKATGNVLAGADEFRIYNAGQQPDLGGGSRGGVPADPLDPLCKACIGPLFTDARHRVTLAGTYRAPLGLDLSGIFRYHSAFPYTIFLNRDVNGDGLLLDLGPGTGISQVNSGSTHSFSQFDLRLSREFRFGSHFSAELIGEVFNLFNEKNPSGYINVFDANGNPIGKKPTLFAGDPLQGEQRLAQLGLRLRF
ncbi:MAG TPA: TonB-dependent receptor [Thermoanaerobaculia bacterium]|nr:TonB-dependent receptor [Thermoanaerobaculia bacterium]